MTRYIFDVGKYPNEIVIDDIELLNDAQAIDYAKIIGADYVWDVVEGRNPLSVYRKVERYDQ